MEDYWWTVSGDFLKLNEMTPEEILNANVPCVCNEAYKSRNMADPDCPHCNYDYEILKSMYQYANQELANLYQAIEHMIKPEFRKVVKGMTNC